MVSDLLIFALLAVFVAFRIAANYGLNIALPR
jgi:hypothetical protein